MDYPIITKEEREFLAYVKQYRRIGYGRMMQIISNEWYARLKREQPGLEVGAFVANTCYAFLPPQEQEAFLSVLKAEQEKGMDY